MSNDPWKHRSSAMSCSTCMWFVVKAPGPLGRYRRHAPTMNGYPVVFPADWCGDHKLDEMKFEVPVAQLEKARQELADRLQLQEAWDLARKGQP